MLGLLAACILAPDSPYLTFEGESGAGKGKHIVLLAGDEEYRSEEALPQLAKILSKRHGFKCTVLFSLNDKGEIDPTRQDHQPGLENLATADLCIMLLRFRNWPDGQMKHFADYLNAGKPIIGLRTSTHAFNYPADSPSPYRHFGWQSRDWPGGFGKQVLGENWVTHWGNHGSQATRGIVVGKHPILSGVKELFGDSDVYEVFPPADADVLVRGQVLSGMRKTDGPAQGRKKTVKGQEQELNDPMMPLVWVRDYKNSNGKTNKIVTSTIGAATDLLDADLRRMIVNAAYWTTQLPVPTQANVDFVGKYEPTSFGFNTFKKGVKPFDLK